MFGNKKLIKRIESLENYLGLAYVPTEDYDYHLADGDHARMGKVNKIIEDNEKAKKTIG